jgi:hypothetical protein
MKKKKMVPTHGVIAQAHLEVVLAQRVDILAQKVVNLHQRKNIYR